MSKDVSNLFIFFKVTLKIWYSTKMPQNVLWQHNLLFPENKNGHLCTPAAKNKPIIPQRGW